MVASRGAGPVVVDGEALADGSQFRGIGTYLRHVVPGVAAQLDAALLRPPDAEPIDGVATLPARRRVLPARYRYAEHDLRLPREIARSGAAVWHSPAQAPPRRSAVPWVQTLHDLTPLVFRHPVLDYERRRWLRIGGRLRRAAAVICVSESSARQGRQLLGLDPSRLHVVPLGVDPAFTPGPAPLGRPPYLLWVAAWGPHKGLPEALQVVERVAAAGLPHRLLLAGRQDPMMRMHVEKAVAASGIADRVDRLGYVEDMADVYRGASALLMTSRAEGFGLPALEAMACGVPVVAFDNTSLPEVVGDAGLVVADGDVGAMARHVVELLRDGSVAADLARRGPARAATFTWDRTVHGHVEVFRALLGRV